MNTTGEPRRRVLVLGGYGTFGQPLVAGLANLPITLVVAGRSRQRAHAVIAELAPATAQLEPAVVDVTAPDLEQRLRELRPWAVIHTAGPFQDQDYRVARACLQAGSHYIDLADGRDFVVGFKDLDAAARQAGVTLVSGASSVPGLSSTVVAQLAQSMSRIDAIDIAIVPGNRADRGLATVRSILGYTGKPLRRLRSGQWVSVRGWMDLRRYSFPPPVGARWLANCDVPDLALFSERFGAATVRFQAGLELKTLHFGLWLAAVLARFGLVRNWAPAARPLRAMADWLRPLGSDTGGMFVRVRGLDDTGLPCQQQWVLTATEGIGPQIPTLPARILIRNWLAEAPTPGARACLAEFALEDFDQLVSSLPIRTGFDERPAPLLVYDGVCGLCNRAVDFLIRNDPEGELYFTHAQGPLGQRLLAEAGLSTDDFETFLLRDADGCWERSTAAVRAANWLKAPARWLGLFRIVPRALRDRLYDTVAKRRYRWFGKREQCRLPSAAEARRFIDV